MHLIRFVDLVNLLFKRTSAFSVSLTLQRGYILPSGPPDTLPNAEMLDLLMLQYFRRGAKKDEHYRSCVSLVDRRSSIEILPCHVTALRRYTSQRHMEIKGAWAI